MKIFLDSNLKVKPKDGGSCGSGGSEKSVPSISNKNHLIEQ